MTLDVGFFVSRFYNQQKEIDLNSLHSDAKFSKWYAPVIESLYKMGGSGKRPDVHQKIIKDYGITDDELKVVNSTGNAQVLNDIDWARNYLVYEGVLDKGENGLWTLTELGKKLIITEELASKLTAKWVKIKTAEREHRYVLEAYVRVGNESVKATSTELKRLVLRGRNTSYDSQISTYKVEDFAFSKLRERYKKWTGNSFDEKDLISFGVANEQGYLTNAGALVADESPIRWSRIFCTRWNGLNKSGGTIDAFDDAEYSGSVLSLIDNGEAFIKRNAKLMWRKTANSREEMPEYVERSYHEALVNALAHRDYLVNGSEVHIDIYDDRMEIYSPGGMPDGSIIQDRDPLTVPSTRRNPVLADIFNRLGYMERKGSGFGKIIGGYEFQINYDESKKPSFRSDRYQFTVVMPNLNYNVPQNVPQDVPRNVPQKKESNPLEIQILNMIKKDNKISTEKMAMTLGISSKTVKRHIKDIGIVRFIGRGSNGHWEIIDD